MVQCICEFDLCLLIKVCGFGQFQVFLFSYFWLAIKLETFSQSFICLVLIGNPWQPDKIEEKKFHWNIPNQYPIFGVLKVSSKWTAKEKWEWNWLPEDFSYFRFISSEFVNFLFKMTCLDDLWASIEQLWPFRKQFTTAWATLTGNLDSKWTFMWLVTSQIIWRCCFWH